VEAELGEELPASPSIVTGSARKILGTKPPNVTALQPATNSTKNEMPSASLRRRRAMGLSGVIAGRRRQRRAASRAAAGSGHGRAARSVLVT
jgi:hypothetical protein